MQICLVERDCAGINGWRKTTGLNNIDKGRPSNKFMTDCATRRRRLPSHFVTTTARILGQSLSKAASHAMLQVSNCTIA